MSCTRGERRREFPKPAKAFRDCERLDNGDGVLDEEDIGRRGRLGCTVIVSGANAAVDAAKAKQLAQKYNCPACHAVDKKLVGPSYDDVAKKYKGDSGAEAKLIAKVKAGGSGVWGQIPMPPNNVPDADVKTLVEWILSLQ
jgi:cytochrome c